MPDIRLAAVKHAAREQAEALFEGNYTLPDNSVAEFNIARDEPGLFMARAVSNGSDILVVVDPAMGVPSGMKLGAWLYPVCLAGKTRVAFWEAMGVVGLPAGETSQSWGQLDHSRYGVYPADLFVFEPGKDGKAVKILILKKSLHRAEKDC